MMSPWNVLGMLFVYGVSLTFGMWLGKTAVESECKYNSQVVIDNVTYLCIKKVTLEEAYKDVK